MKGKFKVLFNVVLCFTAILLAGICVFAGVGKKGCVAQAFGEATEDYSLWDKNTNAIFSVEKVAIEAGENLTETKDFCSPLYTNTNLSDDNVLKKMYSYNFANSGQTPTNVGELERASAVYYDDIRDGTSRKTVVHDNDFVMLNNRPDSQGKYYYSENLTSSYKNGEGNAKMVYMQEAIMVSFGNYFSYTYLDEEGNTAEGFDKAGQVEYTDVNDDRVEKFNSGANIEWMRVSATRVRTGSQTVETLTVPGSRTYQNGRGLQKQDFVWIIPQTEGCEGYYEINVNFSYNGLTNGFTFGFYIVLGSSYNQTLTDNMHNDYSAYPSLKNASAVNGVNHFYLGEMDLTNNNYPTLSYDVTKYALDYVRVANGVSTSFSFNNVEDNGNMRLQSTKTTPSQTYNYDYPIGKVGTKGNIAVVVFTEIGDYSIHFRYKYNNEIAPNMNLQIADIQLSIHGFELKYAKAGFNEAEMRHLTFANNENASTAEMGVGVVVPDGYRSEQESSILETELGVIYDFDRNSTSEVGSLVKLESACVAANSNNLTVDEYVDEEQETGFNIDFAKTNQGSLWFVSTDSFVQRAGEEQGSFYYYGQNLKELKSAEIQPYSNIVSFNQTGYYLVFIKVNAQGVNKNYYSVYAFNYTADTVTVHTEKVDGEKTVSIASDAYTNKSVKIWWEEPGVFEREISVKFLKSKNFAVGDSQTFPSWQELALSIDTQGTTLQNGQIVGGQDGLGAVENGTSAIFLIKLQMVGKSASFRTFTIDKQPITGVQAYAVETKINRLGNVIYSPIKNQDGANVALLNGITDSYATLNWNSKENASGAKISVSYTRTPISPTNAYDVKEMSGWLTTKYTLGKTVGEIDLEKPDLNGELNSSSVLFESGIYLFTLTDEAGNSCRYLFVIDKTENYFKVTEQNGNSAFVTRDSLLYTDQVTVKAGQYKAIELPKTGNEKNDELFEFISAIEKQDGSLASLNYYSQSGTNSGVLASLFKLNGSTHYLTVENRTLSVYNNQRELQHTLNGPTFSYDVLAKGSSNVEQLYLIGANQITTNNPLNSNSYLIVEINTDHALGMAYYGANVTALRNFANLTNSGSNGATRLYYDNNGTLTGLNAAHATGADYLAFSFKLGTNTKYEIKTVGLKYYQLELYKDVQNESFLTNFFYANQPNKEITLYDKDSEIPDSLVLSNDENARAVAILNVVGNKTVEGLYVITREYVTNIEAEGEKDTTLLDYYFLVDRNGVIVLSNEIDDKSINGGYISLGLKNNEIPYSSFTTIGVPSGSIRFVENGATREIDYNVYLTTNRLPLVLNVPFGKYFYSNEFTVKPNSVANMQNGTNYYGSEYFAGRLSFDLYFNDIQGQLSDITTVPVHLLYSVEASGQKGYISYNIKQQLTNTEIKNCFVAGDGEFIALPGDYILVIKDNVEGVNNVKDQAHQKVIGIRVTSNLPSTSLYASKNKDTNSVNDQREFADSSNHYKLTTNKEFVVIDMQNLEEEIFNGTNIAAELDLDYLQITQTRDGANVEYVNYDHGHKSGLINIDDKSDYAERTQQGNKTVNRKIWLNTYLRDENGKVITNFDELKKELKYTIKVRYNVVQDDTNYSDYYYHREEGQTVPSFEREYVVEIDRVPPQANTINLVAQDSLAAFYAQGDMFENYVGGFDGSEETEDGIYFVRTYKDYYSSSTKDSANLYALHVNAETLFSMDDIGRIYTRPLSDNLANLRLTIPANVKSGEYSEFPSADSYGDFGFTVGNYYEIVEKDLAGNSTQYIVFFDSVARQEKLNMTLKAKIASEGMVQENAQISFNFGETENKSYTIFDISSCSTNAPKDKFYILMLYRGGDNINTIKTDFKTSFDDDFSKNIVKFLTEFGPGNYNLVLLSENNRVTHTINYLEAISELLLDGLKKTENGLDYLDLAGANYEQSSGITIYAQTIRVQQNEVDITYNCRVEDGQFNYYDELGNHPINNRLTEIEGKTLLGRYRITVTDMFGKKYPAIYLTFNTNETEPREISFGEDGNANYSSYNGHYYSFTQANINFDNLVYNSYSINYTLLVKGTYKELDLKTLGYILETVEDGRTYITIKPYYEDNNKTGAVLSAEINLSNSEDDEDGFTYRVVLDTTTGSVALRDNALEGANKEYNVDIKFEGDNLFDTTYPAIYSGLFYLSWSPSLASQSNWYKFNYAIYEQMLDGSYQRTDLNDVSYYTISTQETSTGIYRFVIEVLNTNDLVLGYKVYTFAVQSSGTEIYSVKTEDNRVLTPNSQFTFDEVGTLYNGQLDGVDGTRLDISSIKINIPLYVYNHEVVVDVPTKGIKVELKEWHVFEITQADITYKFTIYRVHSLQDTFSLYFGTLIVSYADPSQANLISNVQLIQDGETHHEISSPFVSLTNNKFYGTGSFVLSAEQNLEAGDQDALKIIRKNNIIISIWCNGEFVKNYSATNVGQTFNFDILGSGQYTFVFKDLAGNQHNFNHNGELDGSSRNVPELELVVLREISLIVNGMQAINNAYYNGRVRVEIYRPSLFYGDTRFLNYSFSLNGENYTPVVNQYSFTFSGYGTYKIQYGIRINEQLSLNKVLTFTIVNENEAMHSFDLTPLYNYNITKLVNNRGEETNNKGESLIEKLNTLLNARQDKNKYLLTYEFLQEHAEELGVTSGKQMLTVTYVVDEGVYSKREVEFAFTLNNQLPKIDCNVAPGGTTKDSFTITYVPSTIYEYVGDSELYVNDILVCGINESSLSVNTPQTYKVSFKKDGAGDYYVVLRGSSGTVHSSFKITIKEPLNVWSIIVIVVVVAILLAIVGTIIFLRKKMKIR